MLRRYVRWSKSVNAAVLFFAAIGLGQLAVWTFDRSYPVEVRFRAIQTISVKPSGEFRYINFFTRYKYCDTEVQRWFVGSDSVIRPIDPLPSFMPTEELNKPQQSTAKIKVPHDMPRGPSKSCFQSRWSCNPVQRMWPLYGPETCLEFLVKTSEGGAVDGPPIDLGMWDG